MSLQAAVAASRLNVALLAAVQLGRVSEVFELFVAAQRLPEAALFARSYAPSLVPRALQLWYPPLPFSSRLICALAP